MSSWTPALGRTEPDPEIQALLKASAGLNLALDYLPGSLAFDPAAATTLDPRLASAIVWFDAYVTNVDRTARNTNMLIWHKRALADRPRRGALLPPHLGRLPGAQPQPPFAADQGPRAAAATPRDLAEADADAAPRG